MTNNYIKTMRQALQEAREYRDTTEGGPGSGPQKGGKKFSSSEIKKAYGILNDPRYKQGNYTGAAKAINKLAPGLADHPDVKNAMKRANEELLDLPATGDTTTSNASQEAEQVELDKEWAIMSERTYTMKYDVATGKPFPQTAPPGTDGGNRNPYLAGRSAAKSGKKYSDNPHKVAAKKLYWSKGYIDYKKNPGKNEELDEAKFTPAQVSALKDKYGKLGPGAEKNAVQMDKLAKVMGNYSKSHLSQLADMGVPMVSKVAKELMK